MIFKTFFVVRHSLTDPLLTGSNSTIVASEREDASGDRVLSFALDSEPFHRERIISANEMLNSSTLQPKVKISEKIQKNFKQKVRKKNSN